MKGLLVTYKCSADTKYAKLFRKLFGRVEMQNYRGRIHHTYVKGLLHDKLYKKMAKSILFIKDATIKYELEQLFKECTKEYSIEEKNYPIEENQLETGKEKWLAHALVKDYHIKKWE